MNNCFVPQYFRPLVPIMAAMDDLDHFFHDIFAVKIFPPCFRHIHRLRCHLNKKKNSIKNQLNQ